jgi:subtilisin family serine protease
VKPAWAWQFERGALQRVNVPLPAGITRDWAWGGSTGAGVRVAVLDSGIDASHPAVGGVAGYVAFEYDTDTGTVHAVDGAHEDLFGHGTACAAIIRRIAPAAELYSVRVLGSKLTGRGEVLAAGVRWAVRHGTTTSGHCTSSPTTRTSIA